jgi:hypothetical protein
METEIRPPVANAKRLTHVTDELSAKLAQLHIDGVELTMTTAVQNVGGLCRRSRPIP